MDVRMLIIVLEYMIEEILPDRFQLAIVCKFAKGFPPKCTCKRSNFAKILLYILVCVCRAPLKIRVDPL